ncbi:MAG: class I SAM-dependent methyltransferase [Steroidobacteraceae bacterium]
MTEFDRDYYRKRYFDPRSAVTSGAEMRARARFIAAWADHAGLPVRRILDAGCGIGLMRKPLLRALPRADYTGLEYSAYLCERYGWQRGSIASYRNARPFELTICYDVLQYLGERDASRALANLARLTRGALYFSALTREDWRHNCDRSRTDGDVNLRPASWYRSRLERNFREVGMGLWLRRGAPITLWALE